MTSPDVANIVKPPRLPRWTRQEILTLIDGKRMVESRGKSRSGSLTRIGSPNPVEPKWASVSNYCKEHGVDRGPVQCRKRWSNLASDYKKIKEWEMGMSNNNGNGESYWVMRNDVRREKKLPGFFDKEVYDILDAGMVVGEGKEEEDVEIVFDSGRRAEEDAGLFGEEEEMDAVGPSEAEIEMVTPISAISEKKLETPSIDCSDSGLKKGKRTIEPPPEKAPSTSQEGPQKRRRTSEDEESHEETNLQAKLLEVLDTNSRMLTAQLEAQNANNQLDREQRKEQSDVLLGVLTKVADALGRIADKM